MKDLVVLAIVFGSLPFILRQPWIGVLMWAWVGVMNPHRLGYGMAAALPLAAIIAGTTIVAMVVRPVPKTLPLTAVTVLMALFVLWMNLSGLQALMPDEPGQWPKVMKMMAMTFVALVLIRERVHIHALVCVLVLSLGFYGIKGGLFTIATGGNYKVWGPPLSSLADNNEIALALVMTIPLMHYLQLTTTRRWLRHALTLSMLLCLVAILGSYSRGALLALSAMFGLLALRSRHRAAIVLLLAAAIPLALNFMPEAWMERMSGISSYEHDGSAMGRLNAWTMTFNLALDHPFFGGGFQIYLPELFAQYAPNPEDLHVAHSIYFQALGEHGFVGLGLYLLMMISAMRTASWIRRNSAGREELRWAWNLASMLQVSLLGFLVGGAFLSLVYLDFTYYLIVALVATRALIEREENRSRTASNDSGRRGRAGIADSAPARLR